MSFELAAWAIKQEPKSAVEKLALITLADHYNSETRQCNPSMERIAVYCLCSSRTAMRAIQSLEDQGFVYIHKVKGKSNRYRLLNLTSDKLSPVTPEVSTSDTHVTTPVTPMSHKPVTNQESKPVTDPNAITSDHIAKAFDYFYNKMETGCRYLEGNRAGQLKLGYPKKQDKVKAEKRFTSICKKLKTTDQLNDIVNTIDKNVTARFKGGEWRSAETGFIPNPDRYLLNEKWNDEPITQKGND